MKTNDELSSLRNLIERVRVAMLTTVDAEGALRSRPLQTLELDAQGRLWFFTMASPAKREAMNREHRQVGITYADPNKQDYASISGTGGVVHDRDRMQTHWNAWVELWFPQGIDDPDLALLCVHVEHADYWEAPGSAGRAFVMTEASSRPVMLAAMVHSYALTHSVACLRPLLIVASSSRAARLPLCKAPATVPVSPS